MQHTETKVKFNVTDVEFMRNRIIGLEVEVSDFATMKRILEHLGFHDFSPQLLTN